MQVNATIPLEKQCRAVQGQARGPYVPTTACCNNSCTSTQLIVATHVLVLPPMSYPCGENPVLFGSAMFNDDSSAEVTGPNRPVVRR